MRVQTRSPHDGDHNSVFHFDLPGMLEKYQNRVSEYQTERFPNNVLHYGILLAVVKLKSHCIHKYLLLTVIKDTSILVASNQLFSLKGKQFVC